MVPALYLNLTCQIYFAYPLGSVYVCSVCPYHNVGSVVTIIRRKILVLVSEDKRMD